MRDLGVGSDPAGRLWTGEELKFSAVRVHDEINQEFDKQTNVLSTKVDVEPSL